MTDQPTPAGSATARDVIVPLDTARVAMQSLDIYQQRLASNKPSMHAFLNKHRAIIAKAIAAASEPAEGEGSA